MNKKSFFNVIFFSFLCCLCFFSCQKTENPNDISNLTSQELVSVMSPGWNLGNTLDVCNADRDGDGKINENAKIVNETLWGNPFTTKELFVNLKNDGIKAVRIPVTWRDHLDKNNKIDKEWMNRVQQIVDWALEENLFVIINMHHDGGGDPQFGAWIIEWAYKDYKKFYERYSSIWKQICRRFKNYDEHLIFESMNEVGFDATTQKKAYSILNKINQDFVNIIRSSSGKTITFGFKERYDLRNWIYFLNSKLGDSVPVLLDGVSMGAATVLMCLGLELPQNVKCAIADCGYTRPYDIMKKVFCQTSHLPEHPIMDIANLLIKINAHFWAKKVSATQAMKTNKVPVFFAHGKSDDFVPYEMTLENYNACLAPKHLLLVENADHCMCILLARERYIKELKEFFAEQKISC